MIQFKKQCGCDVDLFPIWPQIKKLDVCQQWHCVCYLLGLECCFDHKPALGALVVFHLQDVMAQVFTSHCHKSLLSLQTRKK